METGEGEQIDYEETFEKMVRRFRKDAVRESPMVLGKRQTPGEMAVHVFDSLLQPVKMAVDEGKKDTDWAKEHISTAARLALKLYGLGGSDIKDQLERAWKDIYFGEAFKDWNPFEKEKKDE